MCLLCKKWLDEGSVVQLRLVCYSHSPFRSSPALVCCDSVLVPAVCVSTVAWMCNATLPCGTPKV